MTNTNDVQTKTDYRKRIAIRMGTSVTLGIVLGTATGKTALGLVVGIIIGGIGAAFMGSGSSGRGEK